MNKNQALIYSSALVMLLTACDVDPYKGKRPIDYPNSIWDCNDGVLVLNVTDKVEDTYGYLTSDGSSIKVTFLWSKLDTKVTVYQAEGDNQVLFTGVNTYGEQSFSMLIDNTNGYLSESSINLICIRK